MRPGYDLLGMAHPIFPFDRLVRLIPKDAPIGFFWNTFGDAKPRFRKLLDMGFTKFRIQCWWTDSHTIVPVNVLRAILEDIQGVVAGRGGLKLYISPSCEHAERQASEVRERLQLVKQIVPTSIPVNNPWKGQGAVVANVLTEYHGSSPGTADLASTDGDNIYDIDAVKWVRAYGDNDHPCFLWGYRFNLREIGDPGQKPPPIKDRKAAPSVDYFKSIMRLAEPKGTAPKTSFKAERFANPNLWKTHSEDSQEENESTPDDVRENKPILITTINVPNIDLIDCKGKLIGKLPRYGDYSGGLTRYYAGRSRDLNMYGYEIAQKALRQSGSEFLWVKGNSKILGPVNPAFRQGNFR